MLKGLVGITPGNQWFVVVGSYGTAEAAVDDAKQINTRFPGKYQLQVCSPTTVPNSPYRVVIAQYMTYSDAAKVKNDAIAAGLPSDTWLWNPFAVTHKQGAARRSQLRMTKFRVSVTLTIVPVSDTFRVKSRPSRTRSGRHSRIAGRVRCPRAELQPAPGGFGHQPLVKLDRGARCTSLDWDRQGAGKARQGQTRPGPRKHGLRLSPLR